MHLLNLKEINVVSGGTTFRIHQKDVDIDTTGIPSQCVANISGILNAIDANYNNSASAIFSAIGPHADNIINSNCVSSLVAVRDRALNSRVTW